MIYRNEANTNKPPGIEILVLPFPVTLFTFLHKQHSLEMKLWTYLGGPAVYMKSYNHKY